MPEVTSVDAVSGFNGLTVVAAFLKVRIPPATKITPETSSEIATIPRVNVLNSIVRPISETPHITHRNTAMMMGGGILFSNAPIYFPFGLIVVTSSER